MSIRSSAPPAVTVPTPRTMLALLLVAVLTACHPASEFDPRLQPVVAADDTVCAYTGLRLSDFAGPKAQVHFAGEAAPHFFIDTVKMFHIALADGRTPPVRGLFVQDMTLSDWHEVQAGWIDARDAYYVEGGRLIGPLGPTLASFSTREAAARFAADNGGRVLRFADVDADMVILDGGALHDTSM